MTGLWLVLVLACICGAILAGIIRAALRRDHYTGRHRMHTPPPAHPAWLGMERLDETQIAAEVDQGMAAIDELLEQEAM